MSGIDLIFGVIGGVAAAAIAFAATASATLDSLRREATKRAQEQAEAAKHETS